VGKDMHPRLWLADFFNFGLGGAKFPNMGDSLAQDDDEPP